MNSRSDSFREFQPFTLFLSIFIPSHVLLTYLFLNHIGNHPLELSGFVIFIVIFFVIYPLSYGLTTTVDQKKIQLTFGIGLIRKRIEIKSIEAVKIVKSPWYFGWGIRFFPGGVLYNVGGLVGVELTLKGTERVVRIGSRNQVRLRDEILKRLTSDESSGLV
jgi:hypothetical protein